MSTWATRQKSSGWAFSELQPDWPCSSTGIRTPKSSYQPRSLDCRYDTEARTFFYNRTGGIYRWKPVPEVCLTKTCQNVTEMQGLIHLWVNWSFQNPIWLVQLPSLRAVSKNRGRVAFLFWDLELFSVLAIDPTVVIEWSISPNRKAVICYMMLFSQPKWALRPQLMFSDVF
jgi:hypothetical protein